MMQIYPQNIEGTAFLPETSKRLAWTYLHGKLQDEVGYDIYQIDNTNWDFSRNEEGGYFEENIPTGIYECEYNGKKCLLYYWMCSRRQHGLVVYKDDLAANEYALRKYNEKSSFI